MSGKYRKQISFLLIAVLLVFQCGLNPTAIAFAEEAPEEATVVVLPEENSGEPDAPEAPAEEVPVEPATEEPAAEVEEEEEEEEVVEPAAVDPLALPVHNVTQDLYYDTISAAIAAAAEGDTIAVSPGTYDESIVVDVENLTIVSTDGAATTTISNTANPMVWVQVNEFHLDGFSLTSSNTAIWVTSLSEGTVIIENCHFDNSIEHSVIFEEISQSTVQLIENVLDESYMGFYFQGDIDHSSILVDGNTIELVKEWGLYFRGDVQTSEITASNNAFSGDPGQSSMGIYLYASTADLGFYDESSLTITDNSFSDFENDSAIYLYYLEGDSEASISHNDFTNCDDAVYINYLGYEETEGGGSTVHIFENTMTDVYYGVYAEYVYYSSALNISDNVITNCDTAVYVYELEYDASISVLNNVIDDCDYGVYLYYLEYGSAAFIEGNEISDVESYAVEIDYVGYNDPLDPCHATIRDNLIERAYHGIYVDDVYFGSVHIDGNELINCGYGIYMDELGYDGEETDVQIVNNSIVITEDAGDHGLTYDFSYAIYMCCPERVLRIENNVISGTEANMYGYGIYGGDNGCCGDEPFLMYLIGNDISYCGYGVYLDDTPCCMSGDFYISENTFTANEYGIYMMYVGNEETYMEITDNYFLQNDTGLYVYDLDDDAEGFTKILITGNCFMSNEYGVHLDEIELNESESWLGIFGNDFINNGTGLLFIQLILDDPQMMLSVTANNFSGNRDYSIHNQSEEVIGARNNWWGHPDGPVVVDEILPVSINDVQTEGDPVSTDVEFDPWISTVVLTPATASADTGIPQTFTASVYNSDDALVTAAGLTIQFDVTGVNPQSQTVSVGGGSADFTYTGANPGIDSVWATVLFSGEATALRETAVMTWTGTAVVPDDPGDPEEPLEPLPDTGMDLSYLWLGLASIVGGLALKRKRAA